MKTDTMQDEPKLILTYPHKTILNWIAFVTIISFSLIVTWILKNLIHEGTDESGRMIIVIALVCLPIFFSLNPQKIGFLIFIVTFEQPSGSLLSFIS